MANERLESGPVNFFSFVTASRMSLRILPRVSPRHSPSPAILCEMRSHADVTGIAPEHFMILPSPHREPLEFRRRYALVLVRHVDALSKLLVGQAICFTDVQSGFFRRRPFHLDPALEDVHLDAIHNL